MSGFLVRISNAVADGEHDEGGFAEGGRRFGQLSEDADEVSPRGVEHSEVGGGEASVCEGEGVFGDGDHGFVFGEEEPVPDAFGERYVAAFVDFVVVVLGGFGADVVEGVVA